MDLFAGYQETRAKDWKASWKWKCIKIVFYKREGVKWKSEGNRYNARK